MEVMLIVAQAGARHADGTFTLLRGGITRVWGKLPVNLTGCALLRIVADPAESGPHDWRLCVIDLDGKDVVPPVDGKFEVPKGGGEAPSPLQFSINFPTYGQFSFRVTVDKKTEVRWPMTVAEAPPPPQTEVSP